MASTEYTVHRYLDGAEIGTVELTAEEFADYVAFADRDTGVVTLSELDGVNLTVEDVPASTTVYLEE